MRGAGIALLALLPLLLSARPFYVHLLILTGIYYIVATGLALVFGLAGQLSLAHAAFFGIGAYSSAILATRAQVPVLLGLLAGSLLSGIAAWVLARPVFRLRGFYLAMATLAFAEIMVVVFEQEVWLTGGPTGIVALPPPSIGGVAFDSTFSYYYLVLAFVVFAMWITNNILRSVLGRGLRAVASSEIGAESTGIEVSLYKTWVFVLSAVFAAAAGSLFVHFQTLINPDNFSVQFAITIVIVLAVGGMDTVAGALLGSVFLAVVPNYLAIYPRYNQVIFGLVFLGVVIFLPRGLAGLASRLLLGRNFRTALSGEEPELGPSRSRLALPGRGQVSAATAGPARASTASRQESPPLRAASGRSETSLEESALIVRDVKKTFGGVKALRDVSFQIAEGSLTGLIGPNGAGKTTMLNVISRYIDPDGGMVEKDGVNIVKLRSHEVAHLGVSRTFQTPHIFERLTVRENVMVGAAGRQGRAELARFTLGTRSSFGLEVELRDKADRWLTSLGLESAADSYPDSLPFGKLRLLEIARAAAANPRLILMDEPSSGLSTAETAELRRLLDELRDGGATVLLVEHNMRLVMAAATRVVVLDQGSKLAEGSPAEIQLNPAVQRAYLGGSAEPRGQSARTT